MIRLVDASAWPEARALAEELVALTDDSVRTILLYGSRLLKTRPDPNSALDFVVIVDDYRRFYRALARADELHRPVALMAGLSRVLTPNVLAFTPDDGARGIAKCLVVSADDFGRALGPAPPDHFLLGRMVQRVGRVWAASDADLRWVDRTLRGAHARVLEWMAPYLEEPVTAGELGRRLLEVCYRGELRPESRGRAGAVFEAQADHFSSVLAPGLEAAVATGRMVRVGERYALARPVLPRVRARWRRHFLRSKARATLRWLKHMFTFANWLPYMVRKVERHTGRTIRLTVLERRLPLLFLWPRAVHVLLTRPEREVRRSSNDTSNPSLAGENAP